jgi:hypothetical protein
MSTVGLGVDEYQACAELIEQLSPRACGMARYVAWYYESQPDFTPLFTFHDQKQAERQRKDGKV